MQKLLERLRTREQRASAVQALSGIALDLTKNGNGHHVIKHCLEIFSFQENEVRIFDSFISNLALFSS